MEACYTYSSDSTTRSQEVATKPLKQSLLTVHKRGSRMTDRDCRS